MGSCELVATDEPSVIAKSFPDSAVVQDRQGNRCLPNATGTNESDRVQVFCKAYNPFDELVTSETGSWRGGEVILRVC